MVRSGRHVGGVTVSRSPSRATSQPIDSRMPTTSDSGYSTPTIRAGKPTCIVTGTGGAGWPTSVTAGSATPPPCSTRRSTASWAAAAASAGSTPRSKRRDASEGSLCRRALRATVTGSKCAASMSRSRVSAPTSVSAPPITPAMATARSPATVGDEEVGGVERAVDVVQRRDPLARAGAADDDRRLEGGQVERVQRLAEAEHDVVRHVDRQRDRAHPRLGQAHRHPARRGRRDVDAAHDAGDVPVAAVATPDGGVVAQLDREPVSRRCLGALRPARAPGRCRRRRWSGSTRARCRASRSSSRGRA